MQFLEEISAKSLICQAAGGKLFTWIYSIWPKKCLFAFITKSAKLTCAVVKFMACEILFFNKDIFANTRIVCFKITCNFHNVLTLKKMALIRQF